MTSPSVLKQLKMWNMGNIQAHIYLVKRDVRAIASISVPTYTARDAVAAITKEGLRVLCRKNGESHLSIFMYTYPHLKHVIKFGLSEPCNITIMKAWLWGKLFGYAESEIAEYIDKQSNNKQPKRID